MSASQMKMLQNLERMQEDADIAIKNGINPYENCRQVDVGNNWDYEPKQLKEKVKLTDE